MGSDRLSVRLSKSLRSSLEALVDATGRTESELAREALEEYLLRCSQLPSCFDLAEDAGVIGCVESQQGDLSTNPRHMEGFGR